MAARIPIPNYMKKIGIVETINAFLVTKDVRSGMMLQPPDYKERTEKDPQTALKIETILNKFPELVPSITSNHFILFAKRGFTSDEIPTDATLGGILGYPCADEFKAATLIKDSAPTTALSVMVKLKDTVDVKQKEYTLFANVCLTDAKRPVFEAIARAAEDAIRTNSDLSKLVDSFYVKMYTTVPPNFLMKKLIHAEPFTDAEMFEFRDIILFNIGFREEGLINYPFDFTNPIHRGVGMALISLFLNDPLVPFYPLQLYPGKDRRVYEQIAALEDELRFALDSANLVLERERRSRKGSTRRRR